MAANDGWETITPAPSVKDDSGWETVAPAKSSSGEPAVRTSAGGTALRSGAEAAAATPAALLGARAGFAIAPPMAPVVGPFSKPLGGLVGAIAGGMLGAEGIDTMEGWIDHAFGTNIRGIKQQQQKEHPTAALVGQVAGGALNPWMKIGMAGSVKQAAVGAGVMTGVGAGMRAVEGGDAFDPKAIAADAVSGAFTKPTARGERLLGHTPQPTTPPPTDLPPKPPESATPQEKAEFLTKIKKIKAEREAKIPLVETAIRNKETGYVERMGPKHDEQRKLDTADTHDQGFVDEKGNFLDRKQAWERAKSAGQIPEGQVPENIKDGLHSGDLRTAGDERFKITEEQPAGEPKPVEEPQAPKSREDHKKAITDNTYKRLDLEIQAEEAAGRGEDVTKLNEQIKALEQEHQQLQKDMPAVEFANPVKPTWEELHDHLWGTKNLGEAFDRVLESKGVGSTGQRVLIKALNKSNFIRQAHLSFEEGFIKYTDAKGVEHSDAAGLYTGGLQHEVQLGKEGDLQTMLHEAIHAGTQRLLMEGTSTSAIEMQKLFDKYKASHGDASYGFTDVHEFASEAFTNKEFQRLLGTIEAGKQPKGVVNSLWGSFKEIVRKGLGIEEGARTALDEVLDRGTELVSRSKDFEPKPDGSAPISASVEGKVDPRNVKDEEEFHNIATDIYEKHGEVEAIKFFEGYKEYQKTWLEPLKETEKFVGTNLKNKLANERIIHNEKAKMLESIPDAASRERVAYAVDAGDLSKLTDAEKALANKYSELVKDIGDRAVENGVVKGLLEDYVTHIIDWEGAPKDARREFIEALLGKTARDPSMKGMDVTSKFAKERKFKTFSDLEAYLQEANARIEAAGKTDFRLRIKTKDIAELYKEYALSMEKAIENKKLVESLKQIRNPAGEAWVREVTKDNPKPEGFTMMDSPQFSGYAVHDNMLPALKFVFDAGPGDLMKALGAISQLTKRLNVIGSFFHAKSLMEVLSSTGIPVWTPVKEVALGGVDKLLGTKYSGLTKAVDQFKKGGVGDNVDRWIKDGGLQLEVPEDVSANILSSSGKFADAMIGKYGPKTRILEKSLSAVEKYTLGYFDKFTWDFLHTGGKLMVADAFLDKARIQAAKEGKLFDEMAQRKQISSFLNDSFGGLNWFDAATQSRTEFGKRIAMSTMSPAGRRGLQIALFAPDWTLSTLRAFSAALPKQLSPTKWHPVEGVKGMMTPTTKADYARLYQFKTALTYFTLLNLINMATADRPIWDNKDPTRIEWPDGTSMQAMKHAMEPFHWLMDPDKTFANKLGFIPKAAVVGLAGTEYASPNAQKLVDPSGPGRLKAVAEMALPFQVQAAKGAPEGEGAKRAVLGTLGFPVYGSTAAQKKAARAEREKQLKAAAKKYHQKAKEKGWEK